MGFSLATGWPNRKADSGLSSINVGLPLPGMRCVALARA